MGSAHHLKRALIAVIATFSLLFMQLAAAAYVCAGVAGTTRSAPIAMDMAPCSTDTPSSCEHLDATHTALCAAQTYASNEATSELRVSKLLASVPGAWFTTFPTAPDNDASRQLPPHSSPGLTRVISPSLSIRNCCYRI
jgi:hypothetical protein